MQKVRTVREDLFIGRMKFIIYSSRVCGSNISGEGAPILCITVEDGATFGGFGAAFSHLEVVYIATSTYSQATRHR